MFNQNFAVRGGWNALPNGLWQFFSEYEPLLRHLICIIYHHYLPWFPSEYHLWIMFDNSYCQHVLSQSQKRCFKEFAHFGKKYWTYSSKSLLNLFIRLKIFILLNIFIPPILKGYTRRNVECSKHIHPAEPIHPLSLFILMEKVKISKSSVMRTISANARGTCMRPWKWLGVLQECRAWRFRNWCWKLRSVAGGPS